MLDIAEFNSKIESVLSRNLDTTISEIKESMVLNDQNVTGQTANSLRKEVIANEGIIYGAEHFKTLEEGISPEFSQRQSFIMLAEKLDTWLWQKHGTTVFRNIASPNVFNAYENQRQFGSTLFRQGGRENVYTDKVPLLTERIMNEIGEVIINTKIL